MPLQVNSVNAPAVMGSNTTATKHFLERLKPIQRHAIRKMELHLLASVTEAWTLQSILHLIANTARSENGREVFPNEVGDSEVQHSRSDLRELAIFVTTRDLLLALADSLTGLLHVLTAPPACKASSRPPTPFGCTASWVSEIAHLTSLRRLDLVIEASADVASQIPIEERTGFANFVEGILPGTNVDIRWKVQQNMILPPDDSESWARFPWD